MKSLLILVPVLLAACAGAPREESVRPGINERFTSPDLDVEKFVEHFEGESREVFVRRAAIARTVGLEPGMAVADVGAGTGLFSELFARDVTDTGRVYAVEISTRFVEHLRQRAEDRGLPQIEAVLCTPRDIGLPEDCVDAVFVCDTYHHFEFPHSTMASIERALRPGGRLVIVDFERVPGVSSEWVLGHVRCGKETVIEEVTAAGFVYVGESDVGLRDNYCIVFRSE